MSRGQQKPKLGDFVADQLVLVVDPSSNFRTSIKQFLTNLKVRHMKFVSSVAEARREMLTRKIGFFIVEWGLDETNGLQFCRTLRKEPAYRDTPFLLLSTENLRSDVVLASEVKIDGYLLKPFSYEDFCTQIAVILKQHTNPSKLGQLLDAADDKMTRGDLAGAELLIQEALSESDKSARALVMLAKIRRQRDDADGALALLKQAVGINSEYIEAFRVMLDLSEERQDRVGIVQAASVLHNLSPDNPRYTLVLARTYLDMDQLEGSETYFRKTIQLSPRMAEAFKGLGSVYLATEEYDKAMKNFKKALDLDENDISTLNSLGLAHVRLGQFKEGIDRYLMALKLNPQDPRVLFNLGHAYEKKGDMEKAKWHYAQALVHKNKFEKALRGLERVEKAAAGQSKLAKFDDFASLEHDDEDEPAKPRAPFKKSS
jgi:tetratricopeptide (TPR) repeat protein